MADNKPSGSQNPTSEKVGILPAAHWATHETPEIDDDNDSSLGDDAASSTASLATSILKYRTINGRTYHSERGNAQYWGPNDSKQGDALDINHHALTLALDGQLYAAPLEPEKIKNVLDVGTGTGIWAIDFADQFPDIEVIGTDISPTQPLFIPPNVKFEIEDCTQSWTFPTNHFDFIHIRGLVGSIDDWNALFQRAFACLKPGGWLESFELSPCWDSDDGTVTETSAMGQWGKIFIQGGKQFGRTFTVIHDGLQRKGIEAAGFVDIQERNIKQPIGHWPKDKKMKERGLFTQAVMEKDAEGLMMFLAGTLGWKRVEIETYLAKFKKEIQSGKLHGYYKQKVVWGRKPE